MGHSDIIRIELKLKGTFPTVNCYLVKGEATSLIDCGIDHLKNWEVFNAKLKESGCVLNDIQRVFLTHQHIDHIGFLPQLLEETEATIYAPRLIQSFLINYPKKKIEESQFQAAIIGKFGLPDEVSNAVTNFFQSEERLLRSFSIPEGRIVYFDDGDSFLLGNHEWRAMHTPGHCSTQFCFTQLDNSRVFGGDMLLPLTPIPLPEEDPEKKGQRMKSILMLLDSYQKLKPFAFNTVYPGHGLPFENANEVIDRQLAKIQKRKQDCFNAVRAGAKTVYEIFSAVYKPKAGFVYFGAIFMTPAYLELLLSEGKIKEELVDNTLVFELA